MSARRTLAVAATGGGSNGACLAASRAAARTAATAPMAAAARTAATAPIAATSFATSLVSAFASTLFTSLVTALATRLSISLVTARATSLSTSFVTVLVIALATAQVALSAEPAGARQGASQNVGQLTYEKWCAPCHAPGPDHPGTQALDALYKGSKPGALIERTDLTPPIVKQFVRKGVSVMPFFRKTEISDAELDALATFLSKPK